MPILSLAIVGGQALLANSVGGDIGQKLDVFQAMYTGYNFHAGNWQADRLVAGYAPWAALGVAKRFLFPIVGRPRLGRFLPVSLA